VRLADARKAPNIDDFNKIAALVFAQLYGEFPVPADIDIKAIAKALGAPEKDLGTDSRGSPKS
jgi:hypothetical protein